MIIFSKYSKLLIFSTFVLVLHLLKMQYGLEADKNR